MTTPYGKLNMTLQVLNLLKHFITDVPTYIRLKADRYLYSNITFCVLLHLINLI